MKKMEVTVGPEGRDLMFDTGWPIKKVEGLCPACMTWLGESRFAVRLHYPVDVNGNPAERTMAVTLRGKGGEEEKIILTVKPEHHEADKGD